MSIDDLKLRIFFATSCPLSPGIWISKTQRSNGTSPSRAFFNVGTASSPLDRETTCMPTNSRTCVRISRFVRLSSTMRTFLPERDTGADLLASFASVFLTHAVKWKTLPGGRFCARVGGSSLTGSGFPILQSTTCRAFRPDVSFKKF